MKKEVMMRTKTLLKYIVTLLVFAVSFSSSSILAQTKGSTTIKFAIPISSEYKTPLYSMFFTSSNSFYSAVYENGHEYVREFKFENGILQDMGLAMPDSGVAIGGQINGRPYLYLQYKGDVIPGYPDESPFSFTSHSEEVYVAGYLKNRLVILKQNGKLNLCKAIGNGDRVRYEQIKISDTRKDENGIHIIGDSLYFSRVDKTGFYKLHKSVYDSEKKIWGEPIIMTDPYNIEGTNTLFYVWYEGVEYIASDRDGILTIYAIGDKTIKNPILELLVNNTKTNDTLSTEEEYNYKLRMKIRDKTYEEYVSSNSYGFYNTMVDLTDEMHVVTDGDTIYILEVPKKDLRECKLNIVGRLKSKNGREDLFMAENSNGEKFTLIPVELAIENGLAVDDNLVREEYLSEEDFILLEGVEYAAYGHSVFDPNKHLSEEDNSIEDIVESGVEDNVEILNTNNLRSSQELSEEEIAKRKKELRNAMESGREFTEEELLLLFGDRQDICHVQVGFYKGRVPNNKFWNFFNQSKYQVTKSDRMKDGKKLGDQYTVDLPLQEAMNALSFIVKGFKGAGINDNPFGRIGQWESTYTLVFLGKNGRYKIDKIS